MAPVPTTSAVFIHCIVQRHALMPATVKGVFRQSYGRFIRACDSRGRFSHVLSGNSAGSYDAELRLVLELATDTELQEIEQILFGPSYFSPLIKSFTSKRQLNYYDVEDMEERELYLAALESRFFFLAADSRSTLRGWRPSYRNVLLAVREKLNIPCSKKLPTADLEAEIFLHVEQVHASEFPTFLEELQALLVKGSGILTLSRVYQLMSSRLTGKVLIEAANYLLNKNFAKKGAQIAASNVESAAMLLAAKKGLSRAATRYLGLRSMVSFVGPVLWGTFLADVVIQMLGTDYARILPAIYAFAQIRITRTYILPSDSDL